MPAAKSLESASIHASEDFENTTIFQLKPIAATKTAPVSTDPAAAVAGVKRYEFTLQGKLYSWTHILVQPATLRDTTLVIP